MRISNQVSNSHSIWIGQYRVTSLLDTLTEFPSSLLVGIEPDDVVRLQSESLRGDASVVTINSFLIENGDVKALIDTGVGGQAGPSEGRLALEMAQLGVQPEDVTHVLLTHLHADHAGGAVTSSGRSAFPNARYIAHEAERDFWFKDQGEVTNPYLKEQIEFTQTLKPVLGQFTWVRQGEVLPGMELVHLPGHTPGHSGYRIGSGNDTLLIWGDIVHQPHLQFPFPQVGVVFDINAEEAIATRIRTMSEAAATGEMIAGLHTDFPTFGRVKRLAGGSFGFVPRVWTPSFSQS